MSARRYSLLTNLNRVLIFALTLTGLLMDGPQFGDLPCTVALLVWLWLPSCTRLEAHLLRWTGDKQPSVPSPRTFPAV